MMYDRSWFWMFPMMLLWPVAIGAVIYAAIRFANRDPTPPHRPHH